MTAPRLTRPTHPTRPLRRRATAAVVGVASWLALGTAAAGCGSNDIDRAALTTTTDFAPTHSQAIAAERERLGIPDEDGGALCRAVDAWSAGFPERVEATPAALAEVIEASARRFSDVVVPAVPAELRDEAAALVATIDAAAASLDAVRDDPRSLDALVEAGAVAGYVEYKALYDPAFTDRPSEPVVYRDALVAWIADPCGPKPLDSALAPIGDAGDSGR